MTGLVLDASVTMTWLLADASPGRLGYAGEVLEAMKQPEPWPNYP